MAGSLQDQLLGAGLIKDQKAKNIKTNKRKAEKKSRKTNTEIENEAAKLGEEAREARGLGAGVPVALGRMGAEAAASSEDTLAD